MIKFLKEIDKKYIQIAVLVVITCVIIYILGRLTDSLAQVPSVVGSGISWLLGILTPVIIGMVMTYILYPVMKKIEGILGTREFFKKHPGGKRGAAVAILLLVVLLVVVLLVSLLVSSLTSQLTLVSGESLINAVQSIAKSITSFGNALTDRLREMRIEASYLDSFISELQNGIQDLVNSIVNGLLKGVSNIGNIISVAFFSIIFGIYFLIDGDTLLTYWSRAYRIFFSDRADFVLSGVCSDADRVFSGYIRGQVTDAFILAILVTTAFSIIGIQYALVIGLFTGILNLIPYLGPIFAYCAVTIVCLVNGDITRLVIGLVVMLIIQIIESNVINPRLMSANIHIHPLVVLISIIIGGNIGGIVGMLVAVPCGALIKNWFDKLLDVMNQKLNRNLPADGDLTGGESS